jgi:mRNA interferase HigB
MRLIKPARLVEFGKRYADAHSSLQAWKAVAGKAVWRSLIEVRRDFPSADGVEVASGKTVTVFNIRGGHYRLITAIHYNTRIVYVMRFLTHAEYDRTSWKDTL